MPISPYLKALRKHVGHARLLVPSAAMVPVQDRRALLAHNADTGEWQTLGGMMEPLEHPADAAVREAYEEAGVMTTLTRLLGVFAGPECEIVYPNGDIVAYTVVAFAGELVDPDAQLRPDGEEIASARWFAIEELDAIEIRDFNKTIARAALEPASQAAFVSASWKPGV